MVTASARPAAVFQFSKPPTCRAVTRARHLEAAQLAVSVARAELRFKDRKRDLAGPWQTAEGDEVLSHYDCCFGFCFLLLRQGFAV